MPMYVPDNNAITTFAQFRCVLRVLHTTRRQEQRGQADVDSGQGQGRVFVFGRWSLQIEAAAIFFCMHHCAIHIINYTYSACIVYRVGVCIYAYTRIFECARACLDILLPMQQGYLKNSETRCR
jgi:hypothetical protein